MEEVSVLSELLAVGNGLVIVLAVLGGAMLSVTVVKEVFVGL